MAEKTRKKMCDGISVVVKMTLWTAISYQAVVVLYLLFCRIWGFELPEKIFGISAKLFAAGAQISVLAVFATFFASRFITNPINKMKEALEDVLRGDFFAKAEYFSEDEIGLLTKRFNKVLARFADLNTEINHKNYELEEACEAAKFCDNAKKREGTMQEVNVALERLVRELSLLYDIGQKVNSTIEMSELFGVIERVLPTRLSFDKFAILLVDEKKEQLTVKAAAGFDDQSSIMNLNFRIGEGVSGEAAFLGELRYLPDVQADKRFVYHRGENIESGSFLSIPLKYKKDILGVMNCSRPLKNGFSDEEIRVLTLVANQIALAVENAILYSKTRELSARDELTGLYNRRHFQQVLHMEWKRATRFKRPISLLMIDIDHFKNFNDTFGHAHGDKVLKLISHLLSDNLREVDTLARFGGEEFIVLLPDTDRNGAFVVGEKLRRLVEMERFDEEQRQITPLTISVGISVFPEDAREMDDLIDHADVALYEAKDSGRNRIGAYPRATPSIGTFNRPTLIKS